MLDRVLSVRLLAEDLQRLRAEARRTRTSAGALARLLIVAGLDDRRLTRGYDRMGAVRAAARAIDGSRRTEPPPVDTVVLVRESRHDGAGPDTR